MSLSAASVAVQIIVCPFRAFKYLITLFINKYKDRHPPALSLVYFQRLLFILNSVLYIVFLNIIFINMFSMYKIRYKSIEEGSKSEEYLIGVEDDNDPCTCVLEVMQSINPCPMYMYTRGNSNKQSKTKQISKKINNLILM